jgi:hypothetical protein
LRTDAAKGRRLAVFVAADYPFLDIVAAMA